MLFLVYATALSLLLMWCEDNIIKTPEQIKAEQVKQEEIIKKSGITPWVSPMGKEWTILWPAQGPKHDHL